MYTLTISDWRQSQLPKPVLAAGGGTAAAGRMQARGEGRIQVGKVGLTVQA